jgi:hypothetical protein
VNITIYLPDELGEWAKQNELGLSRMLRAAVEAEKERQATVAATLSGVDAHNLTVEDGEGRTFTARLHGALIAEDHSGIDVYVYLGKDQKVYVYDERRSRLEHDVETEALRDWLNDGPYAEAMHALGEEVVIDIGLPE